MKTTKYILITLSIVTILLLSVATYKQQIIAPSNLKTPYQSIYFRM